MLSKICWTLLALESAWVLLVISKFFPKTPEAGLFSPDHVMALMMFGGVALGIGLLAFLYLGGVALWFHFKHSGFALAVLTLPLALMLSPSK
ncbi:MAG: hypothetical protein FJW32_21630 [Acidobacteria bacterium]|nr:hypothetical protein [Acidobacteriota bacterium]